MKTIDNKKEGRIIQIYPRQAEIRPDMTKENSVNDNLAIGIKEKNKVDESSANRNLTIEAQEKNIQVVKIKPNTYDTLRKSAKIKNNKEFEQIRNQKKDMQSLVENTEDSAEHLSSYSESCPEPIGVNATESLSDINSDSSLDNNFFDRKSGESYKNTDLSSNPTIETNKDAVGETFKNIKHKEKNATFYVKLFALFFFFGVCLCVSGKWKSKGMGEKLISLIDKELNSFSSFCGNFAPIVFSSFIVFASGFTLYAPFITWIYSAVMFFILGVLSGYIVISLGINLVVITTLAIIGVFAVLNVTLCSVSGGMSKIATNGIKGVSIFDGILYFVIYVIYVATTWGIAAGIKGLIC